MGIVIGTQECINSQIHCLGSDVLHMRGIINKKQQDKILTRLNLNGKDITAFCIRIEQKKIMDKVLKIKRKKTIDLHQVTLKNNSTIMFGIM